MKVGDLVEGSSPDDKIFFERGIILQVWRNEKQGVSIPTYWVWLQREGYHHEFFRNQLKLLSEAK